MRVLRDHAEAEDVVQETFLHVFRDAEHFDSSKGTAKNWIAQISYHQALDRRAYLERRHFQRGTEISCVEETLAGGADLDRELGSKLNRAQIDKALGDLSEMQRLTLELFYFEGFDLREISATLNEPLGNIRHHYYRGLEHLRKSIFVQKLRRSDL